VEFNGLDQYLHTRPVPASNNIGQKTFRGLAVWVWIESRQNNQVQYLVSPPPGKVPRVGVDDTLFSKAIVGRGWTGMAVNGVGVPTVTWQQLGPRIDRWSHLYLSLGTSVTTDLLLMGHVEPNLDDRVVGCFRGKLGELYMWDAPLAPGEIRAVAGGYNVGYVTPSTALVAWFRLEEGAGSTVTNVQVIDQSCLRGILYVRIVLHLL
jgi:hypothetical protein